MSILTVGRYETPDLSISEKAAERQAKLEKHKAEYFAKGGKITQLSQEDTSVNLRLVRNEKTGRLNYEDSSHQLKEKSQRDCNRRKV